MQITAVIPFYNGHDTLPATFQALTHLELPAGVNLDVVISCDGHDQEPDISAGQTLPVMVISDERRGQSATTNRGARYARGDLLWLLAQDMTPKPSALFHLLNRYQQFDDPLVQGFIEHEPAQTGDAFVRHVLDSGLQFTFENIADPNNLDPGLHYAPHALVQRDRFLTLGGYDEQLPYGMQDTDFGLRWRLAGGRIVFARDSVVIHDHYFRYTAYREREKSVGRALVDMFIKWRKEAYLNRYLMSYDLLRQHLGTYIESAHKAALAFEEANVPSPGYGPLPERISLVADSTLPEMFEIALGWARLEAIRTYLMELGLFNHLPPLPPDFDTKSDHATKWIREMAESSTTF